MFHVKTETMTSRFLVQDTFSVPHKTEKKYMEKWKWLPIFNTQVGNGSK